MLDSVCAQCGRPVDLHNRHVRFRLPDPVLQTAAGIDAPGVWMSDDDPVRAVMMQVPHIGSFVRVLVPVRLVGGFSVTFGAWLGVHPDDLQRAFRVWSEPEYEQLTLDGRLANALPVWGLLGAMAVAAVREADATPYVVSSVDPEFARVLSDEWPHDQVLAALPT